MDYLYHFEDIFFIFFIDEKQLHKFLMLSQVVDYNCEFFLVKVFGLDLFSQISSDI